MSAVATLDHSAYEIYYLADFFLRRVEHLREVIELWYNALRLDKSRRRALIYAANEVVVRVVEQGQGSACWGYIPGFGGLLENLVHFLGGEHDIVALESLLKVLEVWQRFPQAFLHDYVRLVVIIAETYLETYQWSSPERVLIKQYPLTRKLQEVIELQTVFALYKGVCDEGKGRPWLFPSCRQKCLQTVEAMTVVLMQMSKLLEAEFTVWNK